jgi:hypothetical protein
MKRADGHGNQRNRQQPTGTSRRIWTREAQGDRTAHDAEGRIAADGDRHQDRQDTKRRQTSGVGPPQPAQQDPRHERHQERVSATGRDQRQGRRAGGGDNRTKKRGRASERESAVQREGEKRGYPASSEGENGQARGRGAHRQQQRQTRQQT